MVTGGAGFIGSNLADALLGAGGTVTVFDDLSRQGSELNLAWLEARHPDRLRFVRGDVRDAAAVAEVVTGADVVYHLAGQTAVTTSVADPRSDFEANLLGTFNVLEAARRSPAPPIVVYASTNKVYGSLEHIALVEHATRHDFADLSSGIDETQPLDPQSPYGCSKGSAELYVRDYHRLYGLRTISFRQSCIYGPRQMGVEDQGWVAWFVRAAVRGEAITIFGDGKQVRDLLYVDDLIDAYVRAVDRIETTAGQVFNVGGGPPAQCPSGGVRPPPLRNRRAAPRTGAPGRGTAERPEGFLLRRREGRARAGLACDRRAGDGLGGTHGSYPRGGAYASHSILRGSRRPAIVRILIALTYFRPYVSGLTIYADRLAVRLAERGHQVTVLTSRHAPSLPRSEQADRIRIVRVPVALRVSKGVVMPTYPAAAAKRSRSHDLVNAHLPQLEAVPLAAVARLLRRPYVITYHCDVVLPPAP